MHLLDLHTSDKSVSVATVGKDLTSNVKCIRLKKGAHFPEHVTKVPALLVCVDGDVEYESEFGTVHEIRDSAIVNIPPNEKHWLNAKEDSLLLLIF